MLKQTFVYPLVALTAAIASIPLSASDVRAAVMTFTDQAAWEMALSGNLFETESFDGDLSSFSANSSGNGVGRFLTVDLAGGIGDPGPTGFTGTGFFEGEVDSSSVSTGDGLALSFNTANPISGFGILGLQNDSEQNPSGLDLQDIGIEVNGERFIVSDILGLTNSRDGNEVPTTENMAPIPFIGFTSDVAITSFSFLHGDFVAPGGVNGTAQEFYIDGLVVASASASTSVPESTSVLGLLAMGIFGIGVWSQKESHTV
ncbi:hypothetical protein IQ260_10690 [Leptolyngbya cf. ectocarpi LEGE 11479]|uniref:PEP-CTERM sorting domain-containing protein n=1 Tax=Leptolyngbya cf. ectocarpi LEGE 11479 TaxID=1828722 RepID=A0A928ZT00_LEPEC|nr:hypothetical protein [Leptolyngbya ectocarpi]MBE9067122.1 hypothetical protein [Leptolyngbya cf. ectocarpi LEGE 11479]